MGCGGSKPSQPAPQPRSIEPAAPEPAPRVKLVLLGDSGVGKSCIVQRYVRGAFDPSSKVTVGAAFMSHSLSLPDGKIVKFEIWDTAGQERYASLAPLYYRGASAAVIVYDVTSKESFSKAKHWVSELRKNVANQIVMVLVGNKTDLAEQRIITEEEGQELAERTGMIFIETSAKTAANCALVFEAVAKKVSGYEEPASELNSQALAQSSDAAPPLSKNSSQGPSP